MNENKGDLISRKYVESIVKAEFVDLQDGTEEWRTYVNDTCENILNKVDNAPTVVVDCKDCDGYEAGYSAGLKDAERPQGEWKNVGFMVCECTNCKEQFHELEANNYCPNCGARMKGGAE